MNYKEECKAIKIMLLKLNIMFITLQPNLSKMCLKGARKLLYLSQKLNPRRIYHSNYRKQGVRILDTI